MFRLISRIIIYLNEESCAEMHVVQIGIHADHPWFLRLLNRVASIITGLHQKRVMQQKTATTVRNVALMFQKQMQYVHCASVIANL